MGWNHQLEKKVGFMNTHYKDFLLLKVGWFRFTQRFKNTFDAQKNQKGSNPKRSMDDLYIFIS